MKTGIYSCLCHPLVFFSPLGDNLFNLLYQNSGCYVFSKTLGYTQSCFIARFQREKKTKDATLRPLRVMCKCCWVWFKPFRLLAVFVGAGRDLSAFCPLITRIKPQMNTDRLASLAIESGKWKMENFGITSG